MLAIASASAVAVMIVPIVQRCWRALRAKFCRWERHRTEYATRIVLFNGNALLFGNAIFGCLNEILCRAHDANNREDAKRYGQITFSASAFAAIVKAKRCFKARKNRLGKITFAAATAAVAFVNALYHACSEKDGRYDLNNSGGFVLFVAFLRGASAEVLTNAMALENADVTFATVKDNAFFKHSDTFNFLRASCANASLKYDFYVKFVVLIFSKNSMILQF